MAEILIDSENWMTAMKCEFPNVTNGIRNTPLRLLIKTFPDLAKKVFDKCTQTNLQQLARDDLQGGQAKAADNNQKKERIISAEDERFQIAFNYELLDDSYTIFKARPKGHSR